MEVTNLAIPVEEYDDIQNSGRLSDKARERLDELFQRYSIVRVAVFGSSTTGVAVKGFLGHRFCGYVDSDRLQALSQMSCDGLIVATSPLHYDIVIASIRKAYENASFHLIILFGDNEPIPVRLILETQPRSGTGYVIHNLMKCCKWGYSSVFFDPPDQSLTATTDNRLVYRKNPDVNGYIVKAHFFKPLCYPEYRYVKTIFQLSYPFDAYYSWAKLLVSGHEKYRLVAGSKEWQVLQAYLPLNRRWLGYLRDRFWIRYEDYYRDFRGTIQKMADFLGVETLQGFEPPRPNAARMYWSDNYRQCFDESVFMRLKETFEDSIPTYWPEKVSALSY